MIRKIKINNKYLCFKTNVNTEKIRVDFIKDDDSQTNERSGTNKLVPFPSESQRTQESIPRPLGRNRTAKAVLGPGLALGYDTFHYFMSLNLKLDDSYNSLHTWMDVQKYSNNEIILESESDLINSAVYLSEVIPNEAGFYKEENRPLLHFTHKIGWVNDPNGMYYKDGVYHLFYQHNPYDVQWDNMHWGHAISEDLVHWQECEEALYPDTKGSMFSGSAVVDHNNTSGFSENGATPIVLFYTNAEEGIPFVETTNSSQCIAYSNDDGKTFIKYNNNPILNTITQGNRDPKVIWHEQSQNWVMILYMEKHDFEIFTSPNLKDWKAACKLTLPNLNECPDIFPLCVDEDNNNVKWIIQAGAGKFWKGATAEYYIGTFDGKLFILESGPHKFDYGRDIYSMQTFDNTADRRIHMSWRSRIFNGFTFEGLPANGEFTFPNELKLKTVGNEIKMYRYPVKELEELLYNKILSVDDAYHENEDIIETLKAGKSQVIKISAKIEKDSILNMVVNSIDITYNESMKSLTALGKTCVVPLIDGKISLLIISDVTSLEVYAQRGLFVFSGYTDINDCKIQIKIINGKVFIKNLEIYSIDSIWKDSK